MFGHCRGAAGPAGAQARGPTGQHRGARGVRGQQRHQQRHHQIPRPPARGPEAQHRGKARRQAKSRLFEGTAFSLCCCLQTCPSSLMNNPASPRTLPGATARLWGGFGGILPPAHAPAPGEPRAARPRGGAACAARGTSRPSPHPPPRPPRTRALRAAARAGRAARSRPRTTSGWGRSPPGPPLLLRVRLPPPAPRCHLLRLAGAAARRRRAERPAPGLRAPLRCAPAKALSRADGALVKAVFPAGSQGCAAQALRETATASYGT